MLTLAGSQPVRVSVLQEEMKTFTQNEILAYAKRQVANAEKQRYVLPVFGSLMLVALGFLIKMLHDKSEALQTTLVADEKFLAGVAFAILFVMFSGLAGLGVAQLLSRLKGIEHQTFKRLIELEKKESENQPSDRTR